MGVQNLTPNIKPSPWPFELAHIERSARRFWDELMVAVVFMDGSQAFDSVSGKFLAKTGTVTSVQERHGNGLICGGDTGGYTIPAGVLDGGAPHTILALLKRNSDLAAGDNLDNTIIRNDNGVVNFHVNNATPEGDDNKIGSPADTTIFSAAVVPLNQPIVVGVKYDNTTATLLMGGIDDTSGAHSQSSNTTALLIMNNGSFSNRAMEDCELYGIYVWQRVLAKSEVQYLSLVDFFAPLRPARQRIGFVAAVGGGFFTRRYYDDLLAGVA